MSRVFQTVGVRLPGRRLGPSEARGQEKQRSVRLPEEVIAAWEKEGAEAGWMVPRFRGFLTIRSGGDTAGKPEDVRAFWFQRWRPGVLAKLPAPPRPFGCTSEAPR